MRRFSRIVSALLALAAAAGLSIHAQQPLDPITCTLRFPEPAAKTFTVEMTVPSPRGPRGPYGTESLNPPIGIAKAYRRQR